MSVQLVAQTDFLDINRDPFRTKGLGKTVRYSKNNDRLKDSTYKTVELAVKVLNEVNSNNLILDLNEHDNIEYLKIDKNGFLNRDITIYEVPKLSSLKHIRYLELSIHRKAFDAKHLFKEIALMPNLEYLMLPRVPFEGLDTMKAFESVLKKLKGIRINDKNLLLPDQVFNISELVIKQNNENLAENLQRINIESLQKLTIVTDTLTTSVLRGLQLFKNISHLQITGINNTTQANLIDALSEMLYLKKMVVNDISYSDFKDLARLQHVEQLYIEIDSTCGLDISPLFEMPKLDNLVVSASKVKSLKWRKINNNTLEKLEVNGSIEYIDSNIGGLINLRVLDLKFNRLKEIPNNIGNLNRLKELELGYNQIKFLPENISKLKELEVLKMRHNELTLLPSGLGMLKKLKDLELDHNDLQGIPRNIDGCKSLEVLSVNNNFIKVIPVEIYKLNQLEILDLSNNSLVNIQDGISNLKKLNALNLHNYKIRKGKEESKRKERSYNDIVKLPEDLWKLNQIEILNLSGNKRIGNGIIQQVLKLKQANTKISLASCGITELPLVGWASFEGKELDLSKNNISQLPDGLFNTNLTILDLRSNPLGLLDAKLENVTSLKLYGYLTGVIKKEELIKQEDLLEVIMEISGRNYYYDRINPILRIYPLAFELDSAKATTLIDAENYADALFEAGEFDKCIPFYNIAINEDMNRCLRVTNFIYPKIANRSRANLEVGDTISAIHDLEYIESLFGYNTFSEIAMIYYELEDTLAFTKYLDKSIQKYLNKKNSKLGDSLSLLELFIINNSAKEIDKSIKEIVMKVESGSFYESIFKYLRLVQDIKQDPSIDAVPLINYIKSSDFKNTKWNCNLLQQWATKLDPIRREKIESLNTIICNSLN